MEMSLVEHDYKKKQNHQFQDYYKLISANIIKCTIKF